MNTYLPAHFHAYLLQADIARLNPHLCLYCDLFLRNVTKAVTASKRDNHVYPAYVENFPYEPARHPHWPYAAEVLDSAARGCHICRLFVAQLTPQESALVRQSARQLHLREVHGSIRLNYDALRPSGNELSISATYYIPTSWYRRPDRCPGRTLRKTHELFAPVSLAAVGGGGESDSCCKQVSEQSSADLESIAMRWIEECLQCHPTCQDQLLKAEQFPTRLIWVGEDGGSSDVHLVMGAELPSKPNYVTLSHTWGAGSLPSAAMCSSQSTFGSKIDVQTLPQTFQDAICFTRKLRRLGVEYLWIDALCILQDSKEDFSIEGSKMFDIYGNSFCTLAVCTGTDSSVGFFPSVDSFLRHTCVVTTGQRSFAPNQKFSVSNTDVIGDSVRNDMLRSRAWCFQELTLSRRVLYFVRGRVAWECGDSCVTSEDDTLNLRQQSSSWLYSPMKSGESLSRLQPNMSVDSAARLTVKIYQMWSRAIWQYSQMNLTHSTDRCLAIAGVAKQMYHALGGRSEYLVGIWSQYIHTHLLWNVRQVKPDSRRYYQGPSWSWCSVNSAVYNHKIREEGMMNCTSLITASAELRFEGGSNPFSHLQLGLREESAILRVRGPLFEAEVGDRGSNSAAHICPLVVDSIQVSGASLNLDFPVPGTGALPITCLITTKEISEAAGPDGVQLAGLLLVPHDQVAGRYIRVGLAFVLPYHLLEHALGTAIHNVQRYDHRFPGGDYSISIV